MGTNILKVKKAILSLFAVLIPLLANAHDFEVNGIYYNVISHVYKTVEVTFRGSSHTSNSDEYQGEISIPTTICYEGETYSVISIADYAFCGCTSLTGISIPEGIKDIGIGAFLGCSNLGNINIPESVEHIGANILSNTAWYESKSNGILYLDNWILECKGSLNTNVVIKNGTRGIADEAFTRQGNITSVTIPEGVTTVGNYAFEYCSGLTNVTLPKSIIRLGKGILYSTQWEKNQSDGILYLGNWIVGDKGTISGDIIIPNNITGIADWALSGSSITSVTIKGDAFFIGNDAFANCTKLEYIDSPNGVEIRGNGAFSGCTNLSHIRIKEGTTRIGETTFFGCTGLTSIDLPNSVEYIGRSSFYGCKNLKGIIIPTDVSGIDEYTFYGCASLNHVHLPNGLRAIDSDAFGSCTNLAEIVIPSSVENISIFAFTGCSKLKSLTIEDGGNILTLDGEGFCFSDSPLETLYLGRDLKSYVNRSYRVFSNMSTLTSVIIGDEVTSIEDYAFYGCSAMKSCSIGKNVSSIGLRAFEGCKSLLSINIPPKVESIENMAFLGCTSLEEVVMEDGDTPLSLGYNDYFYPGGAAFSDSPLKDVYVGRNLDYKETIYYGYSPFYNKELRYATIGHNVTSLKEKMFDCRSIERLRIETLTPPIYTNFSSSIYDSTVLEVHYGMTEQFRNSDIWRKFKHIEEFGDYNIITYVLDGCVYAMDSVAPGIAIPSFDEPRKDGHTFSGWSEAPETMPANDVTISGTFTINKYLVTFKIGDEVIASDSLEYGAAIVAPEAPEKEGHTFDGWGEVAETVPASDLTCEGSYSVNSYLLTYIVDGDTIQADSVAFGTEIIPLEEPIKEGYTFSGWKEAPETMPAKDVIISGIFTINKYLVTFKIDDEVIASDTLEYGAAIIVPEVPEKEGHTFDGWSDVAETVPASDLTYEGSYSVNSYLLSYTVDGEIVKTDSVAYGTAITALVEPEKEGYTFSGWSEVPETMPANDVVISGVFTINQYTITYVIDGEVFVADTINYGEAIVVPEVPIKEGYDFAWTDEIPETMPAEDIVIDGSYTTGILNAIVKEDVLYIYATNGKRVNELRKGINIVLLKDGSIRKVFRK